MWARLNKMLVQQSASFLLIIYFRIFNNIDLENESNKNKILKYNMFSLKSICKSDGSPM